jgi:hypothetical protein
MTAKPDTSAAHLDKVKLNWVITLLKLTYLNIFTHPRKTMKAMALLYCTDQ